MRGFSSNLYGWFERYGPEATRAQILHDCRVAGLEAVEATATPETLAILKAEGLRLSGNYCGVPLHHSWSDLNVESELLPFATCIADGGGTDWLINADPKVATEADLRSVVEFAGDQVGLCIDTGWAWVSGCDPIAWVRDYPERVYALHLRNQFGAVPAEDLLEGEIDMAALIDALKGINYDGWLAMELWHPSATKPQRTMIEDVARSFSFLRSLVDN